MGIKDVSTTLTIKGTPQNQGNKCFSCKKDVTPTLFFQPRYCEYYGKYYCKTCHINQKAVIPARVIQVTFWAEWLLINNRIGIFIHIQ
jgi:hypothetical protein